MNKLLLILFCSFVFLSCSTPESKFNTFMENGSCAEGMEYIKNSNRKLILDSSTSAAGKASSYVLTGLGYGADILIITTGGVIIVGAVCSPAIALDVAAKSNGQLTSECLKFAGRIIKSVDKDKLPSIGEKTFDSTSTWRCPSESKLNSYMIKASRCYLKKGTKEFFSKAKRQLEAIKGNPIFSNCLSASESLEISKLEKLIGISE